MVQSTKLGQDPASMETEESSAVLIAPLPFPRETGGHLRNQYFANRVGRGFEPPDPIFPLSVLVAELKNTKVFLTPFLELSLLSLQVSFVLI